MSYSNMEQAEFTPQLKKPNLLTGTFMNLVAGVSLGNLDMCHHWVELPDGSQVKVFTDYSQVKTPEQKLHIAKQVVDFYQNGSTQIEANAVFISEDGRVEDRLGCTLSILNGKRRVNDSLQVNSHELSEGRRQLQVTEQEISFSQKHKLLESWELEYDRIYRRTIEINGQEHLIDKYAVGKCGALLHSLKQSGQPLSVEQKSELMQLAKLEFRHVGKAEARTTLEFLNGKIDLDDALSQKRSSFRRLDSRQKIMGPLVNTLNKLSAYIEKTEDEDKLDQFYLREMFLEGVSRIGLENDHELGFLKKYIGLFLRDTTCDNEILSFRETALQIDEYMQENQHIDIYYKKMFLRNALYNAQVGDKHPEQSRKRLYLERYIAHKYHDEFAFSTIRSATGKPNKILYAKTNNTQEVIVKLLEWQDVVGYVPAKQIGEAQALDDIAVRLIDFVTDSYNFMENYLQNKLTRLHVEDVLLIKEFVIHYLAPIYKGEENLENWKTLLNDAYEKKKNEVRFNGVKPTKAPEWFTGEYDDVVEIEETQAIVTEPEEHSLPLTQEISESLDAVLINLDLNNGKKTKQYIMQHVPKRLRQDVINQLEQIHKKGELAKLAEIAKLFNNIAYRESPGFESYLTRANGEEIDLMIYYLTNLFKEKDQFDRLFVTSVLNQLKDQRSKKYIIQGDTKKFFIPNTVTTHNQLEEMLAGYNIHRVWMIIEGMEAAKRNINLNIETLINDFVNEDFGIVLARYGLENYAYNLAEKRALHVNKLGFRELILNLFHTYARHYTGSDLTKQEIQGVEAYIDWVVRRNTLTPDERVVSVQSKSTVLPIVKNERIEIPPSINGSDQNRNIETTVDNQPEVEIESGKYNAFLKYLQDCVAQQKEASVQFVQGLLPVEQFPLLHEKAVALVDRHNLDLKGDAAVMYNPQMDEIAKRKLRMRHS